MQCGAGVGSVAGELELLLVEANAAVVVVLVVSRLHSPPKQMPAVRRLPLCSVTLHGVPSANGAAMHCPETHVPSWWQVLKMQLAPLLLAQSVTISAAAGTQQERAHATTARSSSFDVACAAMIVLL